MPRVILSGAIANKPRNGGNAWVLLSWALGLKQLGCEVLLVEHIDVEACSDKSGLPSNFIDSDNLRYFQAAVANYLPDQAVLLCSSSESWGATQESVLEAASEADVLVNISGHMQDPRLLERIGRKVFVDLDPGFTQFWHAMGTPAAPLEGHDLYYSVGENIGAADCEIPTCDIDWRPIRQPVLGEHWTAAPPPDRDAAYSTVASWRGAFGGITFNGKNYGVKAHEFRRFLELPSRVRDCFEMALEIYPGDRSDRERLLAHRWRLIDPHQAVASPEEFRDFVYRSKGEFSAAQGVYVHTNSGWFSDRTTRYLAAGRPALVQETGFSRNLPTGEGLLTFRSLDEAIEGVETLGGDYERHCETAREIAHEYFDASVVLTRLLDEVSCHCS